jgi:hypothetical protein
MFIEQGERAVKENKLPVQMVFLQGGRSRSFSAIVRYIYYLRFGRRRSKVWDVFRIGRSHK